jgi:uncharacterized protein (TIGR03083 family)
LRERVLSNATTRRDPGLPTVGASAATPAEAYAHQRERLDLLLDDLDDAVWTRQAEPYEWSVHDLLGHLLCIEDYTGSILGLWDYEPAPGTEHRHLVMSQATIDAERSNEPSQTADTWRDKSARIAKDIARRDDDAMDEQVTFHNLPHSVSSLMTLRAFEVWTHADDMRRAASQDLEAPPPEIIRSMSDLAVNALPWMVMFADSTQTSRPAKIVLTGPGGGTWNLNADSGEPEATIVADVVQFCRLVANRVEPDELDAEYHGDRDLADALLDAARMLAV